MPAKTATQIWAEGYEAGSNDTYRHEQARAASGGSHGLADEDHTPNPYVDGASPAQPMDPYGPPFLARQSYGTAYWAINRAFGENPVLSMLTPEARAALARIAAEALPKEV